MRAKCLALEHNTMSPARAGTQTARSGVEHTNNEATAPPTMCMCIVISLSLKNHKDKYSVQTNLIKHVHFKIMMNHPSCSMTLPVKNIVLSSTVRKICHCPLILPLLTEI